MDISTRLLRVLQAASSDKIDRINHVFEQQGSALDEILAEWERNLGIDSSSHKQQQARAHFEKQQSDRNSFSQNRQQRQHDSDGNSQNASFSKQVEEDLMLFGLKPPVSLEEVKKARNRKIKIFHPDKFLNDPEKMETAKQIMQIYNAAYDRLEQALR